MNRIQEYLFQLKNDFENSSLQAFWAKYQQLLLVSGITIIILMGLGVYTATRFFVVPIQSQVKSTEVSFIADDALAIENDELASSSLSTTSDSGSGDSASSATSSLETTISETSQSVTWYVDVKGAVNVPQVVPVTKGMRIHDAITLAGGLMPDADQAQVNLAQLVTDQMVIYVPKIGEEVQASVASTVEATQTSSESVVVSENSDSGSQRININTADASELQNLSGIGEKRASDIIQYREANGPFETIDDLDKVSGIGEKTMENLREAIVVD
jgi:competence protein ComEA